MGETVGEAFKSFFDFIATAIENIDWWQVGEDVKKFLIGIDWAGVADSFFEAVGAAFGGFAAFLGGLLAEEVVSAVEYFQDKIEEAGGNVAEGILVGIAEALVNIGEWINEHIFQPFIEGFKEAFGIHSPSTVMEEMGAYIIEGLFNGIVSLVDSITDVWESMKTTASEIWDSVKENLLKILDSIKEKILNFKTNITTIWTNTWDTFKTTVDNIITKVKEIVRSFVDWVMEKISAILNAIASVTSAISGVTGKLGGAVSGGAGGLIGGAISDAAAQGFNVPALASGAVIRGGNPFMAILGDQRIGQTNIEAPAGLIKDMARQGMKEELAALSFGDGSTQAKIVLSVNGVDVGEAILDDLFSVMKRRGYDVDVLGVT